MEIRIHPLPLFEEDKTLLSLCQQQTLPLWGSKVTHWQGVTRRGNTLNLYFYQTDLDVEFVDWQTQQTHIHSFDGLEHALPVAEVLQHLGLCMAGQEVAA